MDLKCLPLMILLYALALPIEGVRSQSYPAKTVRIIVPYAPGANADLITRLIAQRLAPAWGQQVLLDNRPGGATNIGSAFAARSAPDGYTLLLAGPPNAINIPLMRKLPYDLLTDFAPIILCTRIPNVLSVHPSVPARSVRELIALAKARPGQLNFASGGLGSANQMAGEQLKMIAKIDIVHVPYKGSCHRRTGGNAVRGYLFADITYQKRQVETSRDRQHAAPRDDFRCPDFHRVRLSGNDHECLVWTDGPRCNTA